MRHNVMRWEKVSSRLAFDSYMKIEEVVYRMPDGIERTYYIRKTRPAAAIVALTPEQEVILTRQYRPGPDEILLELPGGCIDAGESGEQGARRELLEETGYDGDIEIVTQVFDDSTSTMVRTCAVATNCRKVTGQSLDESEFIDVVLAPLKEFRQLLRSGKMTDVEVGYLGLDHLGLL